MIFKIKNLIEQKRYEHNLIHENFSDNKYINGQGIGPVSQMKYGLCHMSFNGCECIAVYNALVYLGIQKKLSDIVFQLEKYKMLFGFFGCNPKKLGKILMQYNIPFEFSDMSWENGAYILSYWTGKRMCSSIHTVFAEINKNGITVYNRYNNCQKAVNYSSYHDFISSKKLIISYTLK